MQQDVDLGVLPVETVLLVADIANRTTRGRPETTGIDDFVAVLVGLHQAGRQPNLAGDDDAIRGRQGLAGDANRPRVNASLLGLSIDQIDDLIGDPVADLVGMALRHAFAGEDIVRTRHRFLFPFLENPARGSQTRELVVPLSTTTGTYARLESCGMRFGAMAARRQVRPGLTCDASRSGPSCRSRRSRPGCGPDR